MLRTHSWDSTTPFVMIIRFDDVTICGSLMASIAWRMYLIPLVLTNTIHTLRPHGLGSAVNSTISYDRPKNGKTSMRRRNAGAIILNCPRVNNTQYLL